METAAPPRNLNIANVLTMLRIAGVPVFGWLLLSQDGESAGLRFASWAAFAVLMITDKVDGDLARKHNLVTNFGKLADPIADKALTGMAFVGLSIIGQLWWWVTILLLVREWGITLMRFMVRKYGVMPAGQGGKLKTMVQVFAIGGYLLPFEIWGDPVSDTLRWITHVLMAIALVLTLGTAVAYVRDALALRRASLSKAS